MVTKMSKFFTSKHASIDFPDSGWSLQVQMSSGDIVISLYWRDKAIPTHQVCCKAEDFKNMLKDIGFE